MLDLGKWHLAPGDLVIAPPECPDPRFRKTVIMITEHGDQGTMGICLNRATERTVASIVEPTGITLGWDDAVYWGGPVQPHTVWILHDSGWTTEHSLTVDADWGMTSNIDMFEKMALDQLPQRSRVFSGVVGWQPDQLRAEIQGLDPWRQEHSWLILNDPNPEWLLAIDSQELWGHCLQQCSLQTVSHWLE